MAELSAILDATVRLERGRILGALLRLGSRLDAAEEAFQEAVLAALQSWRGQLPAVPGAWLMTTAKNRARDAHRRRAVAEAHASALGEAALDGRDGIDQISDDHLRLILTCCHPELSRDNQIALTLKVVGGFSTEEISRAFVCSEATISQRILRAKRVLEHHRVAYAVPRRDDHDELAARVSAVLGVVYAMFNEGHTARTGELMRLDLQAEALRLARLVCDLVPADPEAFGVVALIAFGAARAHTRVDADGTPILLDAQDRSQWNRELLREGLIALARARALSGRGSYVLQAEIAAIHATAPAWERTDWARIVAHYDALVAAAPSPVVELNRAIAVAMRDGPEAGLAALKPLERALSGYHLFYATRAELLERAGGDPRRDLRRALELATNDTERRLIARRLERARGS